MNPASHYAALDLPAVHVGGWYDIHLEGILANYVGMRRQAPTERARRGQRLVVGPWSHWSPQSGVVGDVDFGPGAAFDVTAMRIDWFKHWLQDGPAPDWAPVRLFVMGENVWRDEQEWPLARTVYTPWHLRAGGGLGPEAPDADEAADHFTYDPRDPVPTLGGKLLGSGEVAGPFDQRPVEGRADVLVYTSDALTAPMELTGPVVVELWAATDAPDTDFTAVLIDVHPDGLALNLCEGVVRARHAGVATPLVAGAAYRFTIDLVATSVVLAAGHRLRLHISSSSFPEWEPNPNTGAPIGVDAEADLRVAHQTILHDARHPSRVILPVIPRPDDYAKLTSTPSPTAISSSARTTRRRRRTPRRPGRRRASCTPSRCSPATARSIPASGGWRTTSPAGATPTATASRPPSTSSPRPRPTPAPSGSMSPRGIGPERRRPSSWRRTAMRT